MTEEEFDPFLWVFEHGQDRAAARRLTPKQRQALDQMADRLKGIAAKRFEKAAIEAAEKAVRHVCAVMADLERDQPRAVALAVEALSPLFIVRLEDWKDTEDIALAVLHAIR